MAGSLEPVDRRAAKAESESPSSAPPSPRSAAISSGARLSSWRASPSCCTRGFQVQRSCLPKCLLRAVPVPVLLQLGRGEHAPDTWKLSDEKFGGIIHPRDVFLWYPKGEKTSSTVASTIIGRAYERAGLSVLNVRGELLAAAPGAYAGIAHEHYSDAKLAQLHAVVQRPVLLVLSIREGSDWVESQAFRGDQLRKTKVTSCDSVDYERATCEAYKRYVPKNDQSVGRAWWVIRHERVVDDRCAMLAQLGLECPKEYAIGQRSRREIQDKMTCEKPDRKFLQKEIDCINDVNKTILKRSVTH